ncbi:L-rhamnose/proton symporter RhaT [Granulicella arctica]|uniref:L-rhamnose/proton symporter RhaT n=1 Tax=Granulicella arctica TaxID=940613 RepID=UPI0021E0DE91|nr:L-rhamnose/proton symporter RhaT [Granulicella arctica]
MNATMFSGIGLTMVAGIMAGNCMLPMKFARRWRFEHMWLVFSIVSLLILPWGLALTNVHDLLKVYRILPLGVMVGPVLFGVGWGIAQILFGISVRRLGMGVGYATIVGLGAVFGTLVPLFAGQRALVSHTAVVAILLGVVVMVGGIALTAWGGQVREHSGEREVLDIPAQTGYLAAVLLAVLCGCMAPMLNYAFAFGQGIAIEAVRLGNTPVAAAYSVWPVALFGGLIPNLGYSAYLLSRNGTWPIFRQSASDGFWAILMGVLWMGAMSLYGVSAVYLGALGTSIGWGLLQIFMIMTATLSGVLTGEWRRAPKRAVALLAAGMTGLIGATVLLSYGGR